MTAGAFWFRACSAGHVTIEVNELSDTQEKAEETKKSGGPGKFHNPSFLIKLFFYFTLLCKCR